MCQLQFGMDGEIIYFLFGLFDQCVVKDVLVQIFGYVVDFFQCLIQWYCVDGDWCVFDDLFMDIVDIVVCGQVYYCIGVLVDCLDYFFYFFGY